MMDVGLAPREVRLTVLVVGLLLTGLLGGVQLTHDSGFAGWELFGVADGSRYLALALGLITVLAIVTTIQRILVVRAQAQED
jgi:hypothetical protein